MTRNLFFHLNTLPGHRKTYFLWVLILSGSIFASCSQQGAIKSIDLQLSPNERIVMIGNTLGERMQYFGHFETALYQNFPEHNLVVRNLCWPGDTPDLRPRSQGRNPGKALQKQAPDVLFLFFGYNESFKGAQGLGEFGNNLDIFLKDSLLNNSKLSLEPSKIVLFSPIAFEDLSDQQLLPDGIKENQNISLYTTKMKEIAGKNGVHFVDLFHPTQDLFKKGNGPWTINGCHLNDKGYMALAEIMNRSLFGKYEKSDENYELLRTMVNEKSFQFLNEFRAVNGVHIYGQRAKPFGVVSFPPEFEKLRKMVANRDQRIWEIVTGKSSSLEVDDSNTGELPPIETNYKKPFTYLSTDEAIKKFELPEGYQVNLFASEEDFPELANPVQMSFDDKGRLWVSVMPTYPQYLPGVPSHDKLLIFEDTDHDGKADKRIVFADGLHLPNGFEFANGGVYVAQAPNVLFLKDTDGDDKADVREIVLHGFSSHDSHHSIGAFTSDASGAIYMAEGYFLYSQVETPYGPVRGKNGVIYRFDPKTWKLEPIVRYDFWNPWGICFDGYGETFLADASNGQNHVMITMMTKLPYGIQHHRDLVSITANNMVRPTAGCEIVSSRHFPDDVQGDYMINNAIGLLGTRQHQLIPDGAGYKTELRHDLITSSDPNYRPVDLEFAPDGSLYIVDWHNALIGHMQHSVRDPNRDHSHGRVWRITHKTRPLLEPVKIAGASVEELLEALKSEEYRTRYRARRALRENSKGEVLKALKDWVTNLDEGDENYERHRLEALNVTWGQHTVDEDLLKASLNASDYRVRAAAVRILRHTWDQVPDYLDHLVQAAQDENPRVRIEALVASGELPDYEGLKVAIPIAERDRGYFLDYSLSYNMIPLRSVAEKALADQEPWAVEKEELIRFMINIPDPVNKERLVKFAPTNVDFKTWKLGSEVYGRDAHCVTCHQENGEGIENIYPPLNGSEWVLQDEERLIKLALDGIMGDIHVKGKLYDGDKTPPMTPFRDLVTDEEMAAVLTFVRNSWGNNAKAIKPETVKKVREATKNRKDFWTEKELLKEHPWPEVQ
ncbi:HEAT repeat domain-containing protein [Fulvivirgaceae bacterium BMA10]|uniref:HEAT repeat domain-containing protein n=1 Tax=Splendidivirga corallicola TaxID=3051826 RepID=A0ABT8KJR2_9BACT|nr:HEAT repeat domain-containing protein [Fulvivirgaceae bacterium BMA10]